MGATQPFTYTGYQKDELAGTYFAQAREYNPALGRFMAEDIIRGTVLYPQSLNHYAYCYNNPEGFVDEDGEWATVAIGAAWEFGSTIIESKVKGEDVDWKEVAVNTAKGAAKGAIMGTGWGIAESAWADGAIDCIGDMAEQMIVEGKSLKEVDVWKSAATGLKTTCESFAFNGLVESKFIKDTKLLKNNDEALKKALDLEKINKKAKNVWKRSVGTVWEAAGKNVRTLEHKKYMESLKDFARANFWYQGEESLIDLSRSYMDYGTTCILRSGGMA